MRRGCVIVQATSSLDGERESRHQSRASKPMKIAPASGSHCDVVHGRDEDAIGGMAHPLAVPCSLAQEDDEL